MQQCATPVTLMNQQVRQLQCPKCSNDEVYIWPCDLLATPHWECTCLNWKCRYTSNMEEFLVVTRYIQEEEDKNHDI